MNLVPTGDGQLCSTDVMSVSKDVQLEMAPFSKSIGSKPVPALGLMGTIGPSPSAACEDMIGCWDKEAIPWPTYGCYGNDKGTWKCQVEQLHG
jgi:hypothetical protein